MKTILNDIWHGFWQGFGVELSFFALWGAWKVAHIKFIEKRFDPTHWLHVIADYFE